MLTNSSKLSGALVAEEEKLLACVHCGLCLEACPTYVHTGDENDSPRGRIYLMRAVEEGRLDAESNAFRSHINRCLGCRACEQACPAGVEYGQLLEAARSDLSRTSQQRRGLASRLLRFSLRHIWLHPLRLRMAFAATRLFRNSRLPRFLLWTRLARLLPGRAGFALALLDSSLAAGPAVRAAAGAGLHGQSVDSSALLFKGCVTEGLFARVNRATVRVLRVNGCRVKVPAAQVCCGALHAHAGDLEGARALARRNIDAFADDDSSSVVTNAGGCGAMLVSYAHLLADDQLYAERARSFSARVRDVSQQLETTGLRRGVSDGEGVTTYDASCHLLYGQRAAGQPVEMLRAIQGLEFAPLTGSEVCCGGAGVYNLLEPELSERVLDEKLSHVRETGALTLATGNPGCHMQLGAGARLRGMKNLRLCHPVELLDESYARAGFYEGSDAD